MVSQMGHKRRRGYTNSEPLRPKRRCHLVDAEQDEEFSITGIQV